MQKKSPESCAVFPGALASPTTYELPKPQSSSGATVLAQNFGSLVLSGPKPLRCVRNADEKKPQAKSKLAQVEAAPRLGIFGAGNALQKPTVFQAQA